MANNLSIVARLWQEHFPERVAHSRNIFFRLIKRVRNEGIIQLHHNKRRKIRRHLRDTRSAGIIASAIVTPNDNLRWCERDSSVSTATQSQIFIHIGQNCIKPCIKTIMIKDKYFATGLNSDLKSFIKQSFFRMHAPLKSSTRSAIGIFAIDLTEIHTALREIDNQYLWNVNVWCGILGDQINFF